MMHKAEMLKVLSDAGVKKTFKPYWDESEDERGIIKLEVRKPAKMVGGDLSGSEITFKHGEFKVWTSRKMLASNYSKLLKLQYRAFTGSEAELIVLPEHADMVLPRFGAKIKHTVVMSEAQKDALRARLASFRSGVKALSDADGSKQG